MPRKKGSAVKLMKGADLGTQMMIGIYGDRYDVFSTEVQLLNSIYHADKCEWMWGLDLLVNKCTGYAQLKPRPVRNDEISKWATTNGPQIFSIIANAMATGDCCWFDRMAKAVRLFYQSHHSPGKGMDPLRLWLVLTYKLFTLGKPKRLLTIKEMMAAYGKHIGRNPEDIDARQFRRACGDVDLPFRPSKPGPKRGMKQMKRR